LNSDLRRAANSEGVVVTRDGARIRYTLRDQGAAARRAVLVHSLAMDRSFWQPVADLLPHASVLTYDCRGHGASDKPTGPYTVELFAQDLSDLLDHVGWPSALVAGASMGGCISIAFAAAFPKRTAGLGLFDTTAWYGPEAPKQWAERADQAVEKGLASLVGFQTTRWFGDAFRASHPEVVKHCVDVFLRNDVKAYAETCRMLGIADKRSALAGFAMPTAVVVGEEDYATPVAMAQALHSSIGGSSLTVLHGARHLTPLELPERVASALQGLLQTQPVL
jgi:3-oxoadipate enol-lactonase